MRKEHIDAGEMRERLQVLTLAEVDGGWAWQTVRRTWAKGTVATRKNVWSTHGIGATGVTFLLRRQSLTEENALLWQGKHCFVTSVTPYGFQHLQVEAALVETAPCEDVYTGTRFPAVMTEEYHRHEQLEPYAVNVLRHVLVTPKQISLTPGRPVRVAGVDWPILTAHTLDPLKNEYIIERTVDL